ncbi:MAG: hypothetical protein ACOYMX_02010 [Burkholderiales bacterium]|jgi:hypothetical protein
MQMLRALMLAIAPAAAMAVEPAQKVEMAYFYDVAVFEVTLPGDYSPTLASFGKPSNNPGDLHVSVGPTRVDSGQYADFDVLKLANDLKQKAGANTPPRLVANVAIPKGDTLRFPCGVGSNVDLDFKEAADADDKPATVVARYQTMFIADREVADMGLGLMGKMEPAGEAPIRFVTHSGQTIGVTMLRPGPEGKKEGCIVLMRP